MSRFDSFNFDKVNNSAEMEFINSFTNEEKSSKIDSNVYYPTLPADKFDGWITFKLLPNFDDTSNNIVNLAEVWLHDPMKAKMRLFNANPVFDDYRNNIFSNLYVKMKNSGIAGAEEKKKPYRPKVRSYVLAQIIHNDIDPNMNEKIVILKMNSVMSKYINEKLDEIKKEILAINQRLDSLSNDNSSEAQKERKKLEDKIVKTLKKNPFKFENGRVLKLKMTRVDRNSFSQYSIEFTDDFMTLLIDNEDCENISEIREYLDKHCPVLTSVKTWDGEYTEDEKKVLCKIILNDFSGTPNIISELRRDFPDIMKYESELLLSDSSVGMPIESKTVEAKKHEVSFDDDDEELDIDKIDVPSDLD